MKTHGTNHVAPTSKQLAQLIGFVVSVVTEIVAQFFSVRSFDEMTALLRSKGMLADKIRTALAPVFAETSDEYSAQRIYWENFYRTQYDLSTNFSMVVIPQKPAEGKWKLIFIPTGLTTNCAAAVYVKALATHDDRWKQSRFEQDLDIKNLHSTRTSAECYAVWAQDDRLINQEFLGQSAKNADPDQQLGMTLLEYCVYGTICFLETKQYLDAKESLTLCSGSHDTDKRIPGIEVDSKNFQVNVYWYDFNDANSYGGIRPVHSLPRTG